MVVDLNPDTITIIFIYRKNGKWNFNGWNLKVCYKIDKSKLFRERITEITNFQNFYEVSGSGSAIKKWNKENKSCQFINEVLDSLQCSFFWNCFPKD